MNASSADVDHQQSLGEMRRRDSLPPWSLALLYLLPVNRCGNSLGLGLPCEFEEKGTLQTARRFLVPSQVGAAVLTH